MHLQPRFRLKLEEQAYTGTPWRDNTAAHCLSHRLASYVQGRQQPIALQRLASHVYRGQGGNIACGVDHVCKGVLVVIWSSTAVLMRVCVRMQLLIKGIRSFSPENQIVIEFYRPLTLIVGHNGAGKTVRHMLSLSLSPVLVLAEHAQLLTMMISQGC